MGVVLMSVAKRSSFGVTFQKTHKKIVLSVLDQHKLVHMYMASTSGCLLTKSSQLPSVSSKVFRM